MTTTTNRPTVRPDTPATVAATVRGMSARMLDGLADIATGTRGAGVQTERALIGRELITTVGANRHPYAAATLDGLRVLWAVGRWHVDPDAVAVEPVAPVEPAGTDGDPWGDALDVDPVATVPAVPVEPAPAPPPAGVAALDVEPVEQAARRVVRHFQPFTAEQRANHAASHRLTPGQQRAVGTHFYTHPDVPGRAFDTRRAAARAAVAASEPAPAGVAALDVEPRGWRCIPADRAFTCTACGGQTLYGGGMQTVNGVEMLCNRCDAARIDAHWYARPAGVSAVRVTNADGSSTVGGAFTHKPYPYPADVPPSVRWGLIVSAGGGGGHQISRTRRLITQRVMETFREVYGLGWAVDGPEIIAAREADTRDVDTRARDYLCAYAGQLDARVAPVEPVEMLALAYMTTDADQVAAGIRPAVGTVVTVEGRPGTWHVIERSDDGARRFPFSVRVRQPGHPFNAGVSLRAVAPVPVDGAPAQRWAAIVSAAGDWRDNVGRAAGKIGDRVALALREVYGLPHPIAPESYRDALDRADADDTRDDDTRARDYLTAYAGQIHGLDMVEPVELLARPFTTSDADQVAAGIRPPVGTLVTVTGVPGTQTRGHVIERTADEQARVPFRVLVQRIGVSYVDHVPHGSVTVYQEPPCAALAEDWHTGGCREAHPAGITSRPAGGYYATPYNPAPDTWYPTPGAEIHQPHPDDVYGY